MCVQQQESFSNSRYVSRFNFQRAILSHPCGHCVECLQVKRNEQYVRNYWEVRAATEEGYSIFESFTYDDLHLPMASKKFDLDSDEEDFSCVDSCDLQLFLKRFRRSLDYDFYGADFGFSFNAYSEYGHDDTYADDNGNIRKKTMRPHWHSILNVARPKVSVTRTITKLTKRSRRFLGYYFMQHRDEFPAGFHFDFDKCEFYTFFMGKRTVCTKFLVRHGYMPLGDYTVVFELKPEVFVRRICEAWQNGNTDNWKRVGKGGVPLKNPHAGKSLPRNVFGKCGSRPTELDIRRLTNYCAKYIMKSEDYDRILSARAIRVVRSMMQSFDCKGVEVGEKELFKEAFRFVRKEIGLCHRQSQGYGKSFLTCYLDAERKEELEQEGTIKMSDERQGVIHLPAPQYYIRKMFYTYRKQRQPDGKWRVQWYPTKYGLPHVIHHTELRIARMAQKYEDWYLNMSPFQQRLVDSLMDGRSYEDLARYVSVYRGTVLPPWYSRSYRLPSVEDIMVNRSCFNAFESEYDCESFGQFYECKESVEPVLRPIYGDVDVVMRKKSSWCRRYCLGQDTVLEGKRPFRRFDDIVSVYNDYHREKGKDKKSLTDRLLSLETIFRIA